MEEFSDDIFFLNVVKGGEHAIRALILFLGKHIERNELQRKQLYKSINILTKQDDVKEFLSKNKYSSIINAYIKFKEEIAN